MNNDAELLLEDELDEAFRDDSVKNKNSKAYSSKNEDQEIIDVDDAKDTKVLSSISKKESDLTVKKAKEVKKTKVNESSIRMKKKSDEMHSLYDKVNEVLDDIEQEMTVESEVKPIIPDVIVHEEYDDAENDFEEDYSDFGVLSIITKVLFVIFIMVCIVFMGFIYYICTY